ncbi:MAG: OmpH family outer membrane protein [Proteobacteria bacterium]|nr:OmpH family outer membrane protein [Pseudomonadota bacterium]
MTNKAFLGKVAKAALLATGLAVAGLVPAAMAQQNTPPANTGVPAPKIVAIDRNAILRASKVGANIVEQVTAMTQQAEKEFKAQGDQLRRDGADLQRQIAILAPDVKARKIKDFENKQAGFQKAVQKRQDQIQYGVLIARSKIEQALAPILQGIMKEKGANLLLDRNAIVLGTIDIDITRTAIQRLDQKMPGVKVVAQDPPPGVQLPRQQQ